MTVTEAEAEAVAVVPNALIALRPGPLATVQDLGRPGHRAFGVPAGGAFDLDSHAIADAMAGNGPEAATVELSLFGGSFRSTVPLALAMAGAPMPARIVRDGSPIREFVSPLAFAMEPGDLLTIGAPAVGARCYLAVRGGWRMPMAQGSRSSESPIGPGEALPAAPGRGPVLRPGPTIAPPIDPDAPIRLVDGPDAALIPPGDRDWHGRPYRVSGSSDRMGLRLDGPTIAVEAEPDRLSTPICPGAVQIAGGSPIVLGVACGTMGGYPHVSHVIAADLPRLAQARPGQPLRFLRIDLAEARRLDREAIARRRRATLRLRLAASDRIAVG